MISRGDKRLLGKWVTDPRDIESIREQGQVTLEFTGDGRLIYSIRTGKKIQRMFLTFSVEDDVIVTDQPSVPRIERTRYSLTDDSKLILFYKGRQISYVRETE